MEEYRKYGQYWKTLSGDLNFGTRKIIATCNEYEYLGITFNMEGTDDVIATQKFSKSKKHDCIYKCREVKKAKSYEAVFKGTNIVLLE